MNIKSLMPAAILLAAGSVFAGEFALTNNALQNKITYNGQDLVEKISSKVLAQGEFTPDAKKVSPPVFPISGAKTPPRFSGRKWHWRQIKRVWKYLFWRTTMLFSVTRAKRWK